MVARMGDDVATQCYAEITKKALDAEQADVLNEKIEKLLSLKLSNFSIHVMLTC